MSFKWLLVSWEGDGGFAVVNSRSIAGIIDKEVSEGDSIQVFQKRGLVCKAQVLRMSNDKKVLEREMVKLQQAKVEATVTEVPGPLLYEDLANGDFSPSGSSWGPDSQVSSDSDVDHVVTADEVVQVQKRKLDTSRQYSNNKNRKLPRTPTLRPEPVIPIISMNNRSSHIANNGTNNNDNEDQSTVRVNAEEVKLVKQEITNLKTMLGTLKQALNDIMRDKPTTNHLYDTKTASFTYGNSPKTIAANNNNVDLNTSTQAMEVVAETNSTIHNKSYQHIRPLKYGMIRHNSSKANETNVTQTVNSVNDTPMFSPQSQQVIKSYSIRHSKTTPKSAEQGQQEAESNGMIPIGSGKTFVIKRIYDQIDWHSYTMATRKLLMAVFPRKTLATHSLTGKASPAFTDKPAKLCLDQKKIHDIILTVTDKCKVKECLVRSAITTKCADEYRMYRMKMAKEKKARNGPFRILNGRSLESSGVQQPDTPSENQVL